MGGGILFAILAACFSTEVGMISLLLMVMLSFYVLPFVEAYLRRQVAIPIQQAVAPMRVRESIDILASLWIGGYDRVGVRKDLDGLLGMLTYNDYGLMAPDTLARLLALLDWYVGPNGKNEWDRYRASNLLSAIGKIGDKRAIPAVKRVAAKNATTAEIRNIATAVLANLEQRDRELQQHNMLLRASSQIAESPTLLRASYDVGSTSDPALLVRPLEENLLK